MNEEWCCEKLANLKIKENRISTLTEIRGRLNETTTLESIITNRLLRAPELYECLDDHGSDGGSNSTTNNDEQFALASDILSICMTNLSISQSTDLPQLLQRALTHQRPRIRALALNAIYKELLREPNDMRTVEMSDNLFTHILEALEQDETEVGIPALNILSIVLEERLQQRTVRDALLRMLVKSETIKCRVYELAVNVAKRSAATLDKVDYLLDRAINELDDNNDVLMHVNVLEILTSLAEQNHGLIYLEKRQVFDVINKRIELLEQNPLDRLLVPGIMRFFGKIAAIQPQNILIGYPHMIHCLFECIHSGDASLLPPAFDTFANLANSNEGKILLEEHYSARLREVFEDYTIQLRNQTSEMKNRGLCSLELIFTTPTDISSQISEILHQWFTYMAGQDTDNMQFLMDFCRNPFPDIKVSCLAFIRAVCHQKWGIVALKNTAGFVEFLLDRKTEFDKESKYAKYELIKLLSETTDIFDLQTLMQMRTYVNDGPYFIESIMDVATEGNP